jgi:hypothetical protein
MIWLINLHKEGAKNPRRRDGQDARPTEYTDGELHSLGALLVGQVYHQSMKNQG